MDNMPTWTIIQFIDDGTVEAVPSTWIQGDSCHWPSFAPSKLINTIKNCAPLNTCWPSHSVKIFRNATFDDYIKARNKAKLAEETSDLNTDHENPMKRKHVQRVLTSSDESFDDSVLASPPKIKQFKRRNAAFRVEDEDIKEPTRPNEEICSISKDAVFTEEIPQNNNCLFCVNNEKYFKTLIEQNHILRGLATEVLSEVKTLKTIKTTIGLSEQTNTNSIFNYPNINFPINSDDELQSNEDMMKNQQEFDYAVVELAKFGGLNPYDFVRRTLRTIISNDQTLKYSWLGRKGKRPFNKLKLAQLIICSSERCNAGNDQKSVEIAIQTWLRRASDRRSALHKKL